MKLRIAIAAVAGALSLVACGVEEDPTENITGTESQPLRQVGTDGGVNLSCPSTKALVCHVPPGNPARAHTICVGKPAVKAHLAHHPDSEGPCGDLDGGDPGSVPGTGTPGTQPGHPGHGNKGGRDGGDDFTEVGVGGGDAIDAGSGGTGGVTDPNGGTGTTDPSGGTGTTGGTTDPNGGSGGSDVGDAGSDTPPIN